MYVSEQFTKKSLLCKALKELDREPFPFGQISSMISCEFLKRGSDFMDQGLVLQLGVGVIVGASFTTVSLLE